MDTPLRDRAPAILVAGARDERFDEILTPDALEFLRQLHVNFEGTRR